MDIEDEFRDKLHKYEANIISDSKSYYRHNYIGNIFVTLCDGFKVEKIEYENREFLFEIVGSSHLITKIAQDCWVFGNYIVEATDQNKNLQK